MEQIGDEPYQIKEKFAGIDVAVCEKRVKGIEMLMAENNMLQAILLDDAYQHRYVEAGLNILLIDSNRPVWRDNVMPFGRSRESISGIRRADIVILTKCIGMTAEQKEEYRRYIKGFADIPVYFSAIRYGEPYSLSTGETMHKGISEESHILLVTGIANPQPLKTEIEKRGAKVELMQYADHHNFSNTDFEDMAKRFATVPPFIEDQPLLLDSGVERQKSLFARISKDYAQIVRASVDAGKQYKVRITCKDANDKTYTSDEIPVTIRFYGNIAC
jgi:tetraacyldisaccharide 4'-kinase